MRTTLSILTLCASLVACDVPKSVGDEGTTSGGDSSPPDTESASTTTPATAGSSTTGGPGVSTSPTTASGTTGSETTASPTTGVLACPEFDPGPVGDPDSGYSWECMCQTCELSFPDIPLETVDLFDGEGLCDCLCAEAGCGPLEGEGGVGGGPEDTASGTASTTEGGTESDTDSDSDTSGWPDTDSFGETTDGFVELTVGACLDEGGEVVGDPGDGSVFEPDYVCPSGESPLGILDFEPGMPFPKNGGVCCF